MRTETYNVISSILQFMIAAGAITFGIWQIKINLRLKKLQESVALSIVPGIGLNLNLMNVGGLNLNLCKYQIGSKTEDFEKPLMIAAGAGQNSFLQITVPDFKRGEKQLIKLYLVDDFKEKYISTGEMIIEDMEINYPFRSDQGADMIATTGKPYLSMGTIKTPRIKAWSYQTEKYNWTI